MMAEPSVRGGPLGVAITRLAAAVVIAILVTGWVSELRRAATDPTVLKRDWTAFHRAGRMLPHGDTRDIYAGSFDTQYPFLYPPYVLYACVPVGLLPDAAAYGLIVGVDILALVLSLWLLHRWAPGHRGEYVTAALVVLASAPWNGVVIVGQVTPLLVLSLVAGFACWAGGRGLAAGLCLSLLMVKPNLGLIVACVAAVRGGRRMALGLAVGAAALLLATVPLGWSAWHDWFAASTRMASLVSGATMDLWKHQTVLAFWLTLLGDQVSRSAVRVLWAISIAPMVVGLGCVWWRVWRPQRLPRLLGVTVLFLIAANPYAYFYDGLLLLIPAVIWYVRSEEYADRVCHRVAGLALAAVFAWQHVSLFGLKGCVPLSLTGVFLVVWFAAEVVDLLRAGRIGGSVSG
ncbi:MAG: DUF2029 domain-containing protein [Phycisphaerae bacterium]|nr:DUF2029 domain-containing protein [Phycisphaerae bacterium]